MAYIVYKPSNALAKQFLFIFVSFVCIFTIFLYKRNRPLEISDENMTRDACERIVAPSQAHQSSPAFSRESYVVKMIRLIV